MTYFSITVKYIFNNISLNIIIIFKFIKKYLNVQIKKRKRKYASLMNLTVISHGSYQTGTVDRDLVHEQVPLLLEDHHAF